LPEKEERRDSRFRVDESFDSSGPWLGARNVPSDFPLFSSFTCPLSSHVELAELDVRRTPRALQIESFF